MSTRTIERSRGRLRLRHPNHKYGVFGALAPIAPTFGYPIQEGWQPLKPGSLVPAENPLFPMLKASLTASPPSTVIVNGQEWPVMPLAGVVPQDWIDFNTGGHKLIDAFETWIADGKLNDTPKSFKLTYDGWMANPPKLWPGLTDHNKPGFKVTPLLYVASFDGDDGRRHGDHGTPDVPLDHVPADFWNTSRIFLTDEQGFTKYPAHLKAGEEYYVTALIGNSGNWGAGRAIDPQHKINVRCDAMAFNTVMSPNTPLPALSNLDPTSVAAIYESYFIGAERWDVAGFRFNVDSVFSQLATALGNSGMDLGGATPQEWLNDSHACVKVRIMSGELDNIYKPEGNPAFNLDLRSAQGPPHRPAQPRAFRGRHAGGQAAQMVDLRRLPGRQGDERPGAATRPAGRIQPLSRSHPGLLRALRRQGWQGRGLRGRARRRRRAVPRVRDPAPDRQ